MRDQPADASAARPHATIARYPSSTSTIASMYMRASVEYRIANGDDATTSTAPHATQRRRDRVRSADAAGRRGTSSGSIATPSTPGERPDRDVARPEDLDPAVEQHVVERRRAVVLQRVRRGPTSGSFAMLTVSASSSQRSDFVTKRSDDRDDEHARRRSARPGARRGRAPVRRMRERAGRGASEVGAAGSVVICSPAGVIVPPGLKL